MSEDDTDLAVAAYGRSVCPSCRHSHVWHNPSGLGIPKGCCVSGCYCEEAPIDESPSDGFAMRRFRLIRDIDDTGISGTGFIAEGVAFSDGQVVLRWRTPWPTSVVFHDRGIDSVRALHGHGGNTYIEWVDD